MVRRALDIHLDPDLLQIILHKLGKGGKLHAARICQPAYGQVFPVLIHIAVSIRILPARLLEELSGFLRLQRYAMHMRCTKRKSLREGADGDLSVSCQQMIHESFAIDGHIDRLSHADILHDRRTHIDLREEIAAGGHLGNLKFRRILKQRIAGVRQSIRGIDITSLQRSRHRIPIRDSLHDQVIHFRTAIPIGRIFVQMDLRIRHRVCHIRTCP